MNSLLKDKKLTIYGSAFEQLFLKGLPREKTAFNVLPGVHSCFKCCAYTTNILILFHILLKMRLYFKEKNNLWYCPVIHNFLVTVSFRHLYQAGLFFLHQFYVKVSSTQVKQLLKRLDISSFI